MKTVIDASALLALLKDEEGGDRVLIHARRALISTVNLIEVRSKLVDAVIDLDAATAQMHRLEIMATPFTEAQAIIAADLWPMVKGLDISLADRACLALAIDCGGRLVTADRDWAKLPLDIELVMIR